MHWSITLPPSPGIAVPVQDADYANCMVGAISMQRSLGTPSESSYERNFLEQSSTSECWMNVISTLMFMHRGNWAVEEEGALEARRV